jgi:hypothetical protein
MADSAAAGQRVLSRRMPPVLAALLILVACPCAAANIYAHPSTPTRVVTLGLGLACLVAAYACVRFFLVVDAEGAQVRDLAHTHWLPWSEIDRVEVAERVRGSATIRFVRTDGSQVDVPPSLLQPVKPTGRPAATRMLRDLQRQIEAHRANSR